MLCVKLVEKFPSEEETFETSNFIKNNVSLSSNIILILKNFIRSISHYPFSMRDRIRKRRGRARLS